MNFDKRIWKSGVLAVAGTIVFGIFVFRAAEWSKAVNGDFLVYGQSGGSGGGTATGPVNVTKIIPQIVAGSYDANLTKYSTVIQILNTGSASINVSGNFYSTTGAPSTLSMTANGSQFAGTLSSTALAPNALLVITTTTPTTGTTNWGRIVASGSASISAFFELRDNVTNVLYTRVGVASSSEDLSNFVIPRVRNTASGLDVGFALVNTGITSANLTGTVRNASGAVVASRVYSMAAGSHTAVFANQFFTTGCSPCLTTEPSGTNFSSINFSSDSSQFAAVALVVEGAALSSFPVDRLQ